MGILEPIYFKIFWLIFVFCIGACIGSLINVVVARTPFEKSILWPGSRCGSCFQSISVLSNVPVLSYLVLRGKCRTCGAGFSSRYMWVELFTGLAFAGLFYLDIIANWQGLVFIRAMQHEISTGKIPALGAWVYFLHHAVLLSFLLAAALCDLDGKVIPLSLTITGTVVGLMFATLFPWPWPNLTRVETVIPPGQPWILQEFANKIPRGVYDWPVWGALPKLLPQGSWRLGLLTGLAGAVAGNLMMRFIKFIFEKGMGTEALGLGDADLMMMAGAFLGWQMIVMSFFVGTFAALFFAIPLFISKGERALPFGPGLAIGIMVTVLSWKWIGAEAQKYFFDWAILFIGVTVLGGGMFIMSLLLRVIGRGS